MEQEESSMLGNFNETWFSKVFCFFLKEALASLIDRKRSAAAAGGGGDGVFDGEMGAHEGVFVVEFRAGEEIQARGIDEDGGAGGLDDQIVRILLCREVEFVLKAGAAAGEDFDSQGARGGLGGEDFRDAAGGGRGEAEVFQGCAHNALYSAREPWW